VIPGVPIAGEFGDDLGGMLARQCALWSGSLAFGPLLVFFLHDHSWLFDLF
jgi:hypothetical protein